MYNLSEKMRIFIFIKFNKNDQFLVLRSENVIQVHLLTLLTTKCFLKKPAVKEILLIFQIR